ncbi:MAG: ABC transporter permease subunit [Clostridiales bacterium]|nr:ABC transporter permease subunit [Clostridiales bacterium]
MTNKVAHYDNPLKKRFLRGLSRWQLLVLLAPALIYIFIFNYIPIYGVQIAFRNYKTNKGIWGSDWVGLKHFIKFFSLPTFWTMLKNTLTITLYNLAMFPLPVIFALMLNEVDHIKFKKTVQMLSYAPHFISTVVLCSMVTLFLHEGKGVFNAIIAALGGTRQPFMEQASAFPHIMVISGVWQELGWGAIIYFAALSGVSPELIEAAKIDGANRLQIVTHVNIPTILPTIIIMLIMRCGRLLSLGFEKVYLLQNPLNMDASQIISTYTYEIGLRGGQFSLSSAVGLFNNVVNVIALVIVNAISKKVTETSLW